ncbi:MAG TPA: hypothetical protein VGE20_18675 [Ramlibacter sp.]
MTAARMTAPPSMHTSTGRGNFVVLRAGSLRLLLPHEDVAAAEHLGEPPAGPAHAGIFELEVLGERRAVVALSERLRPLERFPAGRFVLARLHGGEASFAWDEVRVLIDAAVDPRPLPPAMRAGGPIDGYVQLGGELLLCATAPRVLAYAAGAGDLT